MDRLQTFTIQKRTFEKGDGSYSEWLTEEKSLTVSLSHKVTIGNTGNTGGRIFNKRMVREEQTCQCV